MVAQPLSVAETGDRARGCCYAPEPPRWHKIIASFIPGNDLIAGSTPDIGASIKEKGGELVDHGGGGERDFRRVFSFENYRIRCEISGLCPFLARGDHFASINL